MMWKKNIQLSIKNGGDFSHLWWKIFWQKETPKKKEVQSGILDVLLWFCIKKKNQYPKLTIHPFVCEIRLPVKVQKGVERVRGKEWRGKNDGENLVIFHHFRFPSCLSGLHQASSSQIPEDMKSCHRCQTMMNDQKQTWKENKKWSQNVSAEWPVRVCNFLRALCGLLTH